jgi:hypothetical protein
MVFGCCVTRHHSLSRGAGPGDIARNWEAGFSDDNDDDDSGGFLNDFVTDLESKATSDDDTFSGDNGASNLGLRRGTKRKLFPSLSKTTLRSAGTQKLSLFLTKKRACSFSSR